MERNRYNTYNVDGLNIIQRKDDGFYNATSLLAEWNRTKNDNKSISDFIENEKDFYKEFFGKEIDKIGITDNNGTLWLNEIRLRNLFVFLSPDMYAYNFVHFFNSKNKYSTRYE